MYDQSVFLKVAQEWTPVQYNDDELRMYYRQGIIAGELGPQDTSEIFISAHTPDELQKFERDYHITLERL